MSYSLTPGQLLFAKLGIDLDKIPINKLSNYTAVEYFLTVEDEPPPNANNLEKLKRYLESFHHLCEVEDWDRAKEIVFAREITPSGKELHKQLNIWSYYSEQIEICKRLLGKLELKLEGVLMCSLGIAYENLGQYQTSIEYHTKFLEIGRKLDKQEFIGTAMGGLGNAYHYLGEYHKAIEYHKQAFNIHDRNSDLEGMCSAIGNIGNEYYALGDLQKAFEYYEQYLEIAHEFGYREKKAGAMQSLGNCYRVMGQCETAIEYLQNALVIFQEIGNRAAEAVTLNDLGVAYKNLGHYHNAIALQKKSLAICRQVGSKHGEATSLGNLGVNYYHLGHYEMAIDYQEKALDICRKIGDKDGEGRAFINMGNVYAKIGKMDRACLFWIKGIWIYDSLEVSYQVNEIIQEKFGMLIAMFSLIGQKYGVNKKKQELAITENIQEYLNDQLQEIAAEYGNEAAERIVQLIATAGNQ